MASQKNKITSEKNYNSVMKKIHSLMKKGEDNLKNKELKELRVLALAAQAYEKGIYTIPEPTTL